MLVLHFWFLCYGTKMKMRTEQFLGSCPNPRRTVTADTLQSNVTVPVLVSELIFVKCPCNAVTV